MKRPKAGIPPRTPYISVRMTEPEARQVLDLLHSADHPDELAPAGARKIFQRVAFRIRRAHVRMP